MSMARNIPTLLAALLLAFGTALAGEGGSALKADDLKSEPFRDAKTVGSLAAGDQVEILAKQGGWLRVKSAAGSGWVRMLSIRRGAARKGSGDAGEVLGLASGRAGTGRVVATTGIRGLSEEDLKAAKYNEAELKKAESYATTRAEAQQFAASGKLAARRMEYLPAPGSAK
jgi:Bacterial SH3 domain